jgi:hypothetical protein
VAADTRSYDLQTLKAQETRLEDELKRLLARIEKVRQGLDLVAGYESPEASETYLLSRIEEIRDRIAYLKQLRDELESGKRQAISAAEWKTIALGGKFGAAQAESEMSDPATTPDPLPSDPPAPPAPPSPGPLPPGPLPDPPKQTANQHGHKPMRQFDISARSVDDFATLEQTLKRRLSLFGQEGADVLSGARGAVVDGSGEKRLTRTFYAPTSPKESEGVLQALNNYVKKKYGDSDSGVAIASSETDFTTGVNTLMDTANLKRLMEFVKSNGGEFAFEKSGAHSGTLRWSLPSDLMVSGDRGKLVKAPASFRSQIREDEKAYLKKFQDLLQTATGTTASKADILQMSDARKAKVKRDARAIEERQDQAEHPEGLETALGQKLLSDRQRKRLKAQALFKDSGYTPEQIQAGDFFDNDDVMDQIGSDIVGYPVAIQRGIKRARQRRSDRDLEPEDYRRATRAALDRTNAAMRERQAWRDDHPEEPLTQRLRESEERRTPGTKAFKRAVRDNMKRAAARRKETVRWAKRHRFDPTAKTILRSERARRRTDRSSVGPFDGTKRLVQRAASLAKTSVLTAISVAVAAAVKFLSALPGVASDVRAIAAKGMALGMTDSALRGYRHLERVARMDEGSFARTFGALVHSMPDVTTGDSRYGEIIRRIAPIAARDPLSRSVDATVEFALNGGDPGELWNEYANDILRLSYAGVGSLGNKKAFGEALRVNSVAYEQVAPGIQGELADMLTALRDSPNSGASLATLNRIAEGESVRINDQQYDAATFVQAMFALLGADMSGDSDQYAPRNAATQPEREAAAKTGQAFADFAATAKEVKESVLLKILAVTEGVAAFLNDILKTLLGLKIGDWHVFGGQYDPLRMRLDEQAYEANVAARDSLAVQLAGSDKAKAALGGSLAKFGLDTEEGQAKALASWHRGEGVPWGIQEAGLSGAYTSLVATLAEQEIARPRLARATFNINKYENKLTQWENPDTGAMESYERGGMKTPYGYSPASIAVEATNRVLRDYQPFASLVDQGVRQHFEGPTTPTEELRELDQKQRELDLWNAAIDKISFEGYNEDNPLHRLVRGAAEFIWLGPNGRSRRDELAAEIPSLKLDLWQLEDLIETGGPLVYETLQAASAYSNAISILDAAKAKGTDAQVAAAQKKVESARANMARLENAKATLALGAAEDAASAPGYVGQTGLNMATTLRDVQEMRALGATITEAVSLQLGPVIAGQMLDMRLTVDGKIEAGEQTLNLALTDPRTGEKFYANNVVVRSSRELDAKDVLNAYVGRDWPVERVEGGR